MNKLNINIKQFHFNKVAPANVNEDKLVIESRGNHIYLFIKANFQEFQFS